MKNLVIYPSITFEKFVFGKDYLQICKDIYKTGNIILIQNNKFIAPSSYLRADKIYFLKHDKIIIGKSQNIFHKHCISYQQLFYAEVNIENNLAVQPASNSLDKEFKSLILAAEIRWVERFVSWIYDHLAKREAEGVLLTNYPSIRNNFAEVVQHLQLASQIVSNSKSISPDLDCYFTVASEQILKAIHLLARLAGARAFLSGNVITMLSLFQAFHNIYFIQNWELL